MNSRSADQDLAHRLRMATSRSADQDRAHRLRKAG